MPFSLKEKNSLRTKLLAGFSLIIIAFSVTLLLTVVVSQRDLVVTQVKTEGRALVSLLAHDARLAVFSENSEALRSSAEQMLLYRNVDAVRIDNADGEVLVEMSDVEDSSPWGGDCGTSGTPVVRTDQDRACGQYFEFVTPVLTRGWMAGPEHELFSLGQSQGPRIMGVARILYSTKEMQESLRGIIYKGIIVSCAFFLAGFSLTYLLTNRIVGPLRRLTRAVERLGRGEMTESIPVETKDEIGTFAKAFNHMHQSLKKREKDNKELERELMFSKSLATMGRIAGQIAHEVNNRMAVVSSYIQLIELCAGDAAEVGKHSRQALREVLKTKDLLQEVKVFGTAPDGESSLIDVNETIRGLEQSLLSAGGKAVETVIEYHPGEIRVMFGKSQFEQVIVSLVSNARESIAEQGRIEIITGVHRSLSNEKATLGEAKAGTYGTVTVRDSGCGMTDDVKSRAFEPFFSTKSSGTGLGLGLSIAGSLVQMMGGFIDVKTRPAEGSEVTVYIPLVSEEEGGRLPF